MNECQTIKKIQNWIDEYDNPAVMCSFGKDSMVMMHIIFKALGKRLPVIYHRDPWFPWKNEFADRIIRQWNLTVYDWPPINCGIKVKDDQIEIVARYEITDNKGLDIPKNIIAPKEGEPFACGLEMLERPKCRFENPWDLVLIGHKSSDVDPFEGRVPLNCEMVSIDNGSTFAFPLRDWTDEDIWNYIEKHRLQSSIQTGSRYDPATRKESNNKDFNNDYVTACTRCIDPRQESEVFCPLLKRTIANISSKVLRMEAKFDYIGATQ